MRSFNNNPSNVVVFSKLKSRISKLGSAFNKAIRTSHYVLLLAVIAAHMLVSCTDDNTVPKEPWAQEVERLKTAVAPYHDINRAKEHGYDVDLTGYRTQMGHHYLKGSLLDEQFEVEKPEVLLYAPDGEGKLQLVGVEYATPITDMANPPPPPQGFTGDVDAWAINTEFNVWTLHVWIELGNPEGIFAPMNPKLP
jgi:hypothetical protein